MSLPAEKQPKSSPATGRSPKMVTGSDVVIGTTSPPGNVSAAPASQVEVSPVEDADLEIGDEIFTAPTPRIHQGPSGRASTKRVPEEPARLQKEEEKEVEPKQRRKNPLEKRSAAPLNEFKRNIRPQTVLAARAAVDQARTDSPVPVESAASTAYARVHEQSSAPDFRRNKLHGVLDNAYQHTSRRWLDVLDHFGPWIVVFFLLLIIGGLMAWRFFGSLGEGAAVSTVAREGPRGLPAEERVARGRKAVENFLAAQTDAARLHLVMDSERAAPRMKQFYGEMGGRNPVITTWEVGAPVGSKHGDWLPFTFTEATGRKITIPLGETDTGCIVDWENFTAFGEMTWSEFCRVKPATAPKSLRVRLRRADQYTATFDKEHWQACEIEHRTGGPKLTAYSSRTGRNYQDLEELLKGEPWQCALLYLRFDPEHSGEHDAA